MKQQPETEVITLAERLNSKKKERDTVCHRVVVESEQGFSYWFWLLKQYVSRSGSYPNPQPWTTGPLTTLRSILWPVSKTFRGDVSHPRCASHRPMSQPTKLVNIAAPTKPSLRCGKRSPHTRETTRWGRGGGDQQRKQNVFNP